MSTEDTDQNAAEDQFHEAAEQSDAAESKTMDNELENLQIEHAELRDRILRSQAELENFRRRTQREAMDAMKYSAMPVIRSMLPGIDNLQRAIAVAEQTGDAQGLIDGIKMVSQQFADALKANSCEAISPAGEAFDANFHEALSQIPSADHDPMTVLQVVEAGYKIHDRVLRPAKVMVSCRPPEPAAASDDDQSPE